MRQSKGRVGPVLVAALLLAWPGFALAQEQSVVIGSWEGELDVGGGNLLTIVYNIELAEDGTLTGTMDSPDQGAYGIPLSSVTFEEGTLSVQAAGVPGEPGVTGPISEDGTTWSGTFTQGPGSLPLELKKKEGASGPPPRPQEPEPPYPYGVEDVTFVNESAAIELAGTLTVPDGDGPFPGAVLVSGSGPQDRDEALMGHKPFWILADHLSRNGIAVLRYDDRGYGESGGDFSTATSHDFTSDALAGVAFLQAHPSVRAGSVGIVGHSEGGLVGPLAASMSDDVAFVVMLAGPGVTGIEILVEQGRLINAASGTPSEIAELNARIQTSLAEIVAAEPDPEKAAPLMREAMQAEVDKLSPEMQALAGESIEQNIEPTVTQMNSPWMRNFLHYDPRPALEATTVPVLALIGGKDLQVPHEQNIPEIEAALARGGNDDATVMMLPGLNHLFQEAGTGSPGEYMQIEQTFSPQALEVVSAWILERFGSGAPAPHPEG